MGADRQHHSKLPTLRCRPGPPWERTCPVCKTTFETRVAVKTTCSAECSVESRRRRDRERYLRRKAGGTGSGKRVYLKAKECRTCHQSYVPTSGRQLRCHVCQHSIHTPSPPIGSLRLEGFPDYYITSDGRVFSIKGKRLRELRPFRQADGGLAVSLYRDGVRFTRRLVRLQSVTAPSLRLISSSQ